MPFIKRLFSTSSLHPELTRNVSKHNNIAVFATICATIFVARDLYSPTSINTKFALVGTAGDEINYTVKLAGTAAGAAAEASVNYDTASALYSGNNARDCASADNASVDVSIAESDIRAASTDTYSDTLVLMVSPI